MFMQFILTSYRKYANALIQIFFYKQPSELVRVLAVKDLSIFSFTEN